LPVVSSVAVKVVFVSRCCSLLLVYGCTEVNSIAFYCSLCFAGALGFGRVGSSVSLWIKFGSLRWIELRLHSAGVGVISPARRSADRAEQISRFGLLVQ
jgi:hypothetical protein